MAPQVAPSTGTPPFVPPSADADEWSCTVCGLYTGQRSRDLVYHVASSTYKTPLKVTVCAHCSALAYWFGSQMIDPAGKTGPPPNPDMPDGSREDYEEASSILHLSPRGACALLRLAVQKLCVELGEQGENLNTDIGRLVKKGLSPEIQQALDTLRVVGNNAVHPGEMDLKDDRETALALFDTLNFIVEQRISHPKQIAERYAKLPQGARDQIERRDPPKELPAGDEP